MTHHNDARETEATALDKLATELTHCGYQTRLVIAPGRRPSLEVTNPQASALSETILMEDGSYYWSWAECIAPAADVPAVAGMIAKVLAAQP